MCLIPSIDSALGVRVFQISNVYPTIVSSVSLKVSGRIAFWSESVAAADARKAEAARKLALFTSSEQAGMLVSTENHQG